ncbi:hypothetical protein [uncultured Nocardioides sp.]|uniref:hypothetical protein n=1 Tax=uncultured Nocardioides sp. TaxID=198441 RepID=UPI0026058C80|nr:hypothetical protein [uncultured Nocardioides sp.]
MRSRLGSVLAVPAAAALLLGVLAGPAQAEESVVTDATGDVVDADDRPVPEGASGESAADIVWARLNHSLGRVRMVVKVRDLDTGRGIEPNAVWWLRTPGSGLFRVDRTATSGGGVYAEVVDVESGEQVCQAGFGRSPAADTIRFVVDRDCLGDPGWVRFGVLTSNGVREDGFYRSRADDARVDGGAVSYPARIGGPRILPGRAG